MANLDDVADAMLGHDSPVVTAGDLADQLGVTSRHVLDLLRLLERAGEVESKDVGARAVAWWHVERVRPPSAPDEPEPDPSPPDEPETAAAPRERDVGREPTDEDRQPLPRPEDVAHPDAYLDALDLDLAGSGDILRERQEAVHACYVYLREHGTASRSKFVENVYPENEAGYASSGGWWNTVGKKGLAELAEQRDDLRAPSEGAHQWRFVEE